MMDANNQIHFGPMVESICLHLRLSHYYHYADVSEAIELLKYLSGTFCQVCVKDYINSLNYPSCNISGCVYYLANPLL